MSDWAVGDLAVCVDVSMRRSRFGIHLPEGLEVGRAYRVLCVGVEHGETCLQLEGDAPPRSWGRFAYRFRKIRPDEHQACEEEFRILLKLSKKRVSA